MVNGEVHKPRPVFERLEEWRIEGYGVLAALGHQALAMRANNPTLASTYFDNAMLGLVADDERYAEAGSIPTQPAVFARALLNLAPITRELVVNKTISEPEAVKGASDAFIHDLGKQARKAKQLVQGPPPDNEVLAEHQGGLITVFTPLAALGLLMHYQTDIARSNDWMALPAFLEPEQITQNSKRPVKGRWDINVFSKSENGGLYSLYKIYVRSSRWSQHTTLADPETSVVWLDSDLRLPGDHFPGIELDIISDLQSKTKRGAARVEERVANLLEKVEERSAKTIKQSI